MENQIKELLRRDKIRLWVPPYANEDFTINAIPDDLISKYATEKKWSKESVRACLIKLQKNSVDRLIANKVFKETGVATVFVVFIKPNSSSSDENETLKIETELSVNGKCLKDVVGKKLSVPLEHFKLVAAGRVLEDSYTLEEQHVAQLSEILCITLTEDEIKNNEERLWQMSVDQTRHAVNKLVDQVEIADQSGNPLELPEYEKRALSTGIALHEKGKKELKRKHVGLALLCFLEAEKEFGQCQSRILQAVDNYAILCLDIVWCYLELHNVNCLPDAERRLIEAENGFKRSYGKNFERLAVLKRGIENEKVLIIRLQLLQGIMAYYNQNYKRAFTLILEAESGIRQLDVDEEKLIQIISIGYTPTEARLNLRLTGGNVENAIQRIIEDREEAERRRIEEHQSHKDKKLQRKLGPTKNGDKLDIKKYRDLISMGYIDTFAAEALKQANNDLNGALEILYEKQSKGEVVSQTHAQAEAAAASASAAAVSTASASSTITSSTTNANSSANEPFSEESQHEAAFQQLSNMGIATDILNNVLSRHRGDINGAVAELLAVAANNFAQAIPFGDQLKNLITEAVTKMTNKQTKDSDDEAAWVTLEQDMPDDLNAHLDVTLEEEENFLTIYKSLILPHVQ